MLEVVAFGPVLLGVYHCSRQAAAKIHGCRAGLRYRRQWRLVTHTD
jgi:hypothetical protein